MKFQYLIRAFWDFWWEIFFVVIKLSFGKKMIDVKLAGFFEAGWANRLWKKQAGLERTCVASLFKQGISQVYNLVLTAGQTD
ncbi:hypothetical protein [Nitrosomonas eutropha]|nr:hypothetical protein [Nitrosomonas eutropha]